jgi:cytochrome bd-type quinol oxidase subunit 2
MIKQTFAAQFEPIAQFGGFQVSGEPGSAVESFFTIALGFLTVIGGIMFLIYFVLGGLNWISSRGEKEMVAKAQRYMSNALIGLIVVILAWAFTGIIGAALGFSILDLANNLNALAP